MEETLLTTKLIGDIKENFLVENYQRGYRWGADEVKRLLEDIHGSKENNYCLQPLVVKKCDERYEIIDGQQRLTTIYLIYKYMQKTTHGYIVKSPKFSINYTIRKGTKEFLENLEFNRKRENIDFFYIANAYEAIEEWFLLKQRDEDDKQVLLDILECFNKKVKVIWYEVDQKIESIPMFARLNIGKIPLTSSELVKAMFLSKEVNEPEIISKQKEISLQWDIVEKELGNENFWYFLTNGSYDNYSTRIDLILDLYTNNTNKLKNEKYGTFFEIEKKKKDGKTLIQIWEEIQYTFLTLKDWYENHTLYHQIGYLISTEYKTLGELLNISKEKTKEEFLTEVEKHVKNSIKDINFYEIDYDNENDKNKIKRLLLLFNIESVRRNGAETQWFPFDKHKKTNWSIEHIHARHSENFNKKDECKTWLEEHIKSIKKINPEEQEIIKRAEEWMNNPNSIIGYEFEKIQTEFIKKLSNESVYKYNINSIGNLALLGFEDNSALNNSTFSVKRDKIIELDQAGKYIPFCTRNVFLKYYTGSESNNLYFWGKEDMENYVHCINNVLKYYLDEKCINNLEENK